ncbi:sugar transferase [Klebsiella pneumoniae]|uniref:sugar transferase n=1 Tax=Klebsiella pneumoniae TaxID=573 RepID=UPI002F918FEB
MRCFDIAFSLFLLILLSPVFIVLTIAICMSGIKPFFCHERIGLNGRKFKCIKFRSMRDESSLSFADRQFIENEKKEKWKVSNDPRITTIGKFIRKTSMDEIPQVVNVLIGDMSFIGPRPITQNELALYGRRSSSYLSIKPGITGLWQVSGRSNTNYRRRVAIDHFYAKNYSFKMMSFIFFKTIFVVITMNGAE